jgi:hypothetical protein
LIGGNDIGSGISSFVSVASSTLIPSSSVPTGGNLIASGISSFISVVSSTLTPTSVPSTSRVTPVSL